MTTKPPTLKKISHSDPLLDLLQSVFGFPGFRPGQEVVCRAAVEGRDLLLVMPTGAGKSLCYQLPALARGGTALVISPLIALMDDQAAKLAALGLKVARIHSGLDRSVARQACVDYLRGDLQFMFIAPERLRVPGFPEMLAKKKLALVAIDEAHCISQWGHDFRPDYRMLGQYLPGLRGEGDPTPVVAMTATATPSVQADILSQLEMVQPAQFIHGFRRNNLGIEVVELPVPERAEAICSLLAEKDRRPAIVYATSRKQAEKLAEELALRLRAAAYHAGMDPESRERVQTAFLGGELEVIVATIAFGMGIDKANIRTVIHAGLPATLEGYYQEIGRAGRDGAPSRTYLMHSYADQRTHDFFLNRDYPPIEHLNQVFKALDEEPQAFEQLCEESDLDAEAFEKALEKLQIHGGAQVDFGGMVTRGGLGWRKTYTVQAKHRAEQFEKVVRFTESNECRMGALVRHFGDKSDANRPCGQCDVCDPGGAVLRQFRRVSSYERELVQEIIDDLRPVDYKATGTLQRSIASLSGLSREIYDDLLHAMVRGGLIEMEDAEYEKDGETRRYRKVRLTEYGLEVRGNTPLDLLLNDGIVAEFGGGGGKKTARKRSSSASGATSGRKAAMEEPLKLNAAGETLASKLREWRSAEAKKLGIPAFMVLHDRTLNGIAAMRPKTPNQLLAVSGMGQTKVDRFGAALLAVCVG
ncbi:RecQ family ATP-dependent DNA helicase [Telmatobacter bradus]|uniref:RecQ family ATP-dependent DNA helicase n=1 Tax=Telmatobacter bradus TaxID=474953 RepID=UPI003B431347